jgi:hypothetical protein
VLAVQPARIVVDSFEELAEGELPSTSLAEDGKLASSPAVRQVGQLDGLRLWEAVADASSGILYAGAGPDGQIVRLRPNGVAEVTHKLGTGEVYALALSPKGELFAALSPKGKIYKILDGGKAKEFFDPKEEYIWAMTFDGAGYLYAATGTEGKIYRISPGGKGEVWYDSDEAHIRCLAWDKQGRLLAGSAGEGLVYRIEKAGEAVVLLDCPKPEVRRLAVDPEGGAIYAASIGESSVDSVPEGGKSDNASTLAKPKGTITLSSGEGAAAESPRAPVPAAPAKKAGRTTKGTDLHKIGASLYPEKLWSSDQLAQSMLWHDGALWIGTGKQGFVYRVAADGKATVVAQPEAEQITALAASRSRFFWLASNPGLIFQVDAAQGSGGIYRSKVLDSSLFARWGRVEAYGNGRWELRTRSGNTAEPGKAWHPWQAAVDGTVASPPARYFQFEIKILSGQVDRVSCSYLAQNQPPVLKQVRILDVGTGYEALEQRSQPPQPVMAAQLLKGETQPQPQPGDRYQPIERRGVRSLVWEASDPNGDELRYKVEVKAEGASAWTVLAEDLKDTVFSWDTLGWKDGDYRARVTASDAQDNAPQEARTAEMLGDVWQIDHTAPVLRVLAKDAGNVSFEAEDAGSVLTAVGLSLDGRTFQILHPLDGVLDGKREAFKAPRTKGKPLYLRAEDESGNVAGLYIEASE